MSLGVSNAPVAAGQPREPVLVGVAAPDMTLKDPTNAALLYSRAWLLLTPEIKEKTGELVPDSLKAPLSDDAKKAAAGVDELVRALVRASAVQECDWGIEYSQGIGALLPELSLMRLSARALKLSAAAALHAESSDPGAAGDRIVATLRLSRHAVQGRLLISSLVGTAIVQLGCNSLQEMVQMQKLDGIARDAAIVELKRLSQPHALLFRDAVRYGESIGFQTVQQLVDEGMSPEQTAQVIASLSMSDAGKARALKLDGKLLKQDLERGRSYMQALADAWDQPDAELQKLEARLLAGEFGYFATILAPSVMKARDSERKASATISDTLKLLEAYQPPKDLPPRAAEADVWQKLGLPKPKKENWGTPK